MKIIIGVAAEDEVLRDTVLSELMSRAGNNAATTFSSSEEVARVFHDNSGYFELYDFGLCERVERKSDLLVLHGMWLPFHLVCVSRMDQDSRRFGTDPDFRKSELWRFADEHILFTTRPKLSLSLGKEWDVISRKARIAMRN